MQRIDSSWTFATRALMALASCLALLLLAVSAHAEGNPYRGEEQEKKDAANIVGPDKTDNNCQTCHKSEYDAWLHSRHFATGPRPR